MSLSAVGHPAVLQPSDFANDIQVISGRATGGKLAKRPTCLKKEAGRSGSARTRPSLVSRASPFMGRGEGSRDVSARYRPVRHGPHPQCLRRGADQVDRRPLSRVSLSLVLGVSRRRPMPEGCSRRPRQRGDEHRQECQRGAGHDRRRDYAPAHPSLVGLVAYGSGPPSTPAPGHARHRRHSMSTKAPS